MPLLTGEHLDIERFLHLRQTGLIHFLKCHKEETGIIEAIQSVIPTGQTLRLLYPYPVGRNRECSSSKYGLRQCAVLLGQYAHPK